MRYAYYYEKMNAADRAIYDNMYAGFLEHKEEIFLSTENLDSSHVVDVKWQMEMDIPLLFFVAGRISVSFRAATGTWLLPQYYMDAEETKRKMEQVKNAAMDFQKRFIKKGDSRLEVVRKAYSLFAQSIRYDYAALDQDEWQNYPAHTILGVMLQNKAVCEGISESFKLLMDACKIPCICVTGTGHGRVDGHEWNMVEIDGDFYHFDVTWATEKTKTMFVDYSYFALSDDLIGRDHKDFLGEVPPATSRKANLFDKNGWVAGSREDIDRYIQRTYKKVPYYMFLRLDYKCDVAKEVKYAVEASQKRGRELKHGSTWTYSTWHEGIRTIRIYVTDVNDTSQNVF